MILWAAVSTLLLYGWFYNMGQYRETTKDVLVTAGSCIGSLWALRTFLPGLTVTVATAVIVAIAIPITFLSPIARNIPRYAYTAASIVLLSMIMYICDKFIGLSLPVTCMIGAVLFVAFYSITIYAYSRLPHSPEDE